METEKSSAVCRSDEGVQTRRIQRLYIGCCMDEMGSDLHQVEVDRTPSKIRSQGGGSSLKYEGGSEEEIRIFDSDSNVYRGVSVQCEVFTQHCLQFRTDRLE